MVDPIIQVNNLAKTYPGANAPSVTDVSFSIAPGEVLALLGPNGAGKTSTVKMIAGLVTPTSGLITVMGNDIVTNRQASMVHIGAVLEGARNLYWRLSAIENLRYFGGLRLVPRDQLRRRMAILLEQFDLTDHKDKEVGKYSRGMQQKLAIAAALLHEPDVLLLDEPTLGLDVQAARQVEAQVKDLTQTQGKSVLLTTHQMDLAETLADKIFVINQGKQVAYDSTQALLTQFGGHRSLTEIQISGALPNELISQLNDLDISTTADEEITYLTFPATNQDDLLKLLNTLHQHQIPILNVGQRQATLEEVFLSLTTQDGAP